MLGSHMLPTKAQTDGSIAGLVRSHACLHSAKQQAQSLALDIRSFLVFFCGHYLNIVGIVIYGWQQHPALCIGM